MAKVSKIWATSENLWYEELRVIAPYREYQYDRMIQSHLQTLFPEFYAMPYSRRILQAGKTEGSKPDFALIRKDYQEWWVVEVERIEDKLSHVKKQIEDFVNGNYNSIIEAKYLHKNAPDLDYKGIANVTQNSPRVMLIVDDMNSTWQKEFEELDPTTCILKVYRNSKGLELYSISGDYPYIYEEESHCHFSNAMTNLLHIVNPDVLSPEMEDSNEKDSRVKRIANGVKTFFSIRKKEKESDEDLYFLSYQGQVSEWKRVDDSGQVFLQPIGPVNTRINDSYILKRIRDRNFILENN